MIKLKMLNEVALYHYRFKNLFNLKNRIEYFMTKSDNDQRILNLIRRNDRIRIKYVEGVDACTNGRTITLNKAYFNEDYYKPLFESKELSNREDMPYLIYLVNVGVLIHEIGHINYMRRLGDKTAETHYNRFIESVNKELIREYGVGSEINEKTKQSLLFALCYNTILDHFLEGGYVSSKSIRSGKYLNDCCNILFHPKNDFGSRLISSIENDSLLTNVTILFRSEGGRKYAEENYNKLYNDVYVDIINNVRGLTKSQYKEKEFSFNIIVRAIANLYSYFYIESKEQKQEQGDNKKTKSKYDDKLDDDSQAIISRISSSLNDGETGVIDNTLTYCLNDKNEFKGLGFIEHTSWGIVKANFKFNPKERNVFKSLIAYLKNARNANRKSLARDSGTKLLSKNLYRVMTDLKIFGKNKLFRNESATPQVVFLLDQSGSTMGVWDSKIHFGGSELMQACKQLRISCSSYGFTIGKSSTLISLIASYKMKFYSDKDKKFKDITHNNISDRFYTNYRRFDGITNNDGKAIDFAVMALDSNRTKKIGVIIIISDGMPTESHRKMANPTNNLRISIKEARAKGYVVIALALGETLYERLLPIYGNDYVLDATNNIEIAGYKILEALNEGTLK